MFKTDEYLKVIDSFYAELKKVPEEYTSGILAPDKWSLKEIAGHLIDSASNNHQRFVRLQEDDLRAFPRFNQNWVRIQKYNEYDWMQLIELWRLFNLLLLHIINNIDQCKLGNSWSTNGEELKLDYLVEDYFEHMNWHIGHFNNRLFEIQKTKG